MKKKYNIGTEAKPHFIEMTQQQYTNYMRCLNMMVNENNKLIKKIKDEKK